MSQIQFSHSRVSTFEKCPHQYKLHYIDQIITIHDPAADDALIVGNALHTGIEKGETVMLDWYFSQYAVIDDRQVNESIKLVALLRKLQERLTEFDGDFQHEYLIDRPDFKGFVDLMVSNPDGSVDIYDFKYSNNVKNYLESAQLHLYKFYLEREKFKVNRLGFIFVPKTNIRQKKEENLYQFRQRLTETLSSMEVDVHYVDYNFQKVKRFWESCRKIEAVTAFPKNPSRLCDWCKFQKYCLEGVDYMILPKNERRQIGTVKRKTLWIYGSPFSGKTWFANKFPGPLMLNTDGNVDFVDAPFIRIADDVIVEGRITKRKLAWAVFKETIDELEKKQNDFQTIIVDLLEDTYEHCRIFMYDKLGIEHESDNSFKAWDMVRTEFLSTMKRLLNLPYDIVLISHEDMTKDFTKKTGDKVTRIAPNLQEKAALKIAGMVQLVARVVNDDEERSLTFKTSEVEFGGGRLGLRARKIPLEYEEFVKLYDEVNQETMPVEQEKSKHDRKPKTEKSVESVEAASTTHNEVNSPPTDDDETPPWETSDEKQEEPPAKWPEEQPSTVEQLSSKEKPTTEEKPKRTRSSRSA